jgi:predicted metal-dependent hydrolase
MAIYKIARELVKHLSKIYQNILHMHTNHLKEKDMHRKLGTKI